jgi:dihydroxyacetone kinase
LEEKVQCKVTIAYVGAFMTSFNMHGVSLTIFAPTGTNDSIETIYMLLDAETDASGTYLIDDPLPSPFFLIFSFFGSYVELDILLQIVLVIRFLFFTAWSKADTLSSVSDIRPSLIPLQEEASSQLTTSTVERDVRPVVIHNFSEVAISSINAACKALIEGEPKLTEWDIQVGDGDCGITMLRGAKEVLKRLNEGKLSISNPSRLFADLADAVSASMGGTSGILFELMLRKMSTSLIDIEVDRNSLSTAFVEGVQAGSFYGGATRGCRTMMDALIPAADIAPTGSLELMAAAALEGAESTTSMKEALAGRSSYLNAETLMNTPDPGAKAVEYILRAIAESVSGIM